MSHLKTLAVLTRPTSSQESEVGAELSELLVGQMIDQSGPEAAHANLSPRQAKEKGLLTSVTYGPPGIGSSASASLTRSLENKLHRLLAGRGSILFRLTWKAKATPSRRPFFQLVASALRISVNGSGGWPTPCAQDGPNGGPAQGIDRLPGAAAHSSWATPAAKEPGGTPEQFLKRKEKHPCGQSVTAFSLQAQLAIPGTTATGSSAPTESKGQLNPEFSRWLMGYPAAWGSCGATAMQSCRKSPRRLSKRAGKSK